MISPPPPLFFPVSFSYDRDYVRDLPTGEKLGSQSAGAVMPDLSAAFAGEHLIDQE